MQVREHTCSQFSSHEVEDGCSSRSFETETYCGSFPYTYKSSCKISAGTDNRDANPYQADFGLEMSRLFIGPRGSSDDHHKAGVCCRTSSRSNIIRSEHRSQKRTCVSSDNPLLPSQLHLPAIVPRLQAVSIIYPLLPPKT